MGIGGSLVLIGVGAVLAFATNYDISGMNLNMIGWIVMLVGLAGLLLTFLWWRPRRRAAGLAAESAEQRISRREGPATASAREVEETVIRREDPPPP
ncbi:DUF6458 family protein [Allonocardiopsis opalescens]|uniref:DUF6458 domain-containing protein n=1 Tax=Allonocardiopsis opalescens TaxID=1144618 RepID=A0A2T0QCJ3_9ACTN|nr:DUF6458 family protein [Allonocardiopsis opalescens]PRY01632.1 hypothetical protein CLV72_101215 [Allonocardiopsis opalescens]